MKKRASGILLHISSLPSRYGIGDLGPSAYQFVDFLTQAGQSLWQILPLNPTDLACGNSPYSSISAFGVNTLLISPDLLLEEDLLTKNDLKNIPQFPKDKVDYEKVSHFKNRLLDHAYKRFKETEKDRDQYRKFCFDNASWLDDFALFVALKEKHGGQMWSSWPWELRNKEESAVKSMRTQLSDRIEKEKFLQFIFFQQWFSLRNYCQEKGVQLIGDIPIYVNYDSADVWANSYLFKLDDKKKPLCVGGVPPDYFSKSGQLWGNPVYDWKKLKETGYVWWINRMAHNLNLFDILRVDHFRAFVAYWEVPTGERTAVNGHWADVPTDDFFRALHNRFQKLPLIAEDLGIITDDVKEAMAKLGFPGMRILLFAFGEDLPTHPYLPHNYVKNCAVYTGTHDNNTVKGWLGKEADPKDRKRLARYIGKTVTIKNLHWELIRLAMMSVADTVIIPMQDVLGLDGVSRMNSPGTLHGNWQWRVLPAQWTTQVTKNLFEMAQTYGRI